MSEKKYTDRERVYQDCQYVGDVAKFGEGDFRCSGHFEARVFETREEAERWMKQTRG